MKNISLFAIFFVIVFLVSCKTTKQANLLNTVNEPYKFSKLQSRSITQENPTGEKGIGGKDRGNGNLRKGSPAFRIIEPGETKVLCDIKGQGMIRHFWLTFDGFSGKNIGRHPEMSRNCIVRMYWDDSETPSVEAPLSDFFGIAHGRVASYMTPYLGSPGGKAYHCYFPMPFSKRARITIQNDSEIKLDWIFYQVDYTIGDKVTDNMGRFHASFRRDTPAAGKDYVLLDTKGSPGVFVGAVIGVIPHGRGWWGEGEMKFYMDGDDKYPTICGTGTEDYICSGWGIKPHQAIYTGANFVLDNNPKDTANREMGAMLSFYRFHVLDPIYFQSSLRVELQQLGAGFGNNKEEVEAYKSKIGFKEFHVHPNTEKPGTMMSNWLYDRSDDYCSTVFWYQRVTKDKLPPFPSREERIRGIEIRSWEKPFSLPSANPFVNQ